MTRRRLFATVIALPLAACSNSGHQPVASSAQPTVTVTPTVTGQATATAPPALAANIKVYGDCTRPTLKPTQIVLACADYGEILTSLHWSSWTRQQATAVGIFRYNDCTPSCAAGHMHNVPGVRVTLTVPTRGASGGLVWSHIETHPTPDHFPSEATLPTRPI